MFTSNFRMRKNEISDHPEARVSQEDGLRTRQVHRSIMEDGRMDGKDWASLETELNANGEEQISVEVPPPHPQEAKQVGETAGSLWQPSLMGGLSWYQPDH